MLIIIITSYARSEKPGCHCDASRQASRCQAGCQPVSNRLSWLTRADKRHTV